MENLPLPLIIALIVAAIVLGLWVGNRAGKILPGEDGKKKTLSSRAREAATSGVVRLWKWNRARKKDKD